MSKEDGEMGRGTQYHGCAKHDVSLVIYLLAFDVDIQGLVIDSIEFARQDFKDAHLLEAANRSQT